MTLKQRVIQYCDYAGITISAFERCASLSNGYFNQVKKDPSPSKLSKIKSTYPDLNIEWLLTEEGQMLNATPKSADEDTANQPNHLTIDAMDLQRLLNAIVLQGEEVKKQGARLDRILDIISPLKQTNVG